MHSVAMTTDTTALRLKNQFIAPLTLAAPQRAHIGHSDTPEAVPPNMEEPVTGHT
jgi:hypothetical protein